MIEWNVKIRFRDKHQHENVYEVLIDDKLCGLVRHRVRDHWQGVTHRAKGYVAEVGKDKGHHKRFNTAVAAVLSMYLPGNIHLEDDDADDD